MWSNNKNHVRTATLVNSNNENYKLTDDEIQKLWKEFYSLHGRHPTDEEFEDLLKTNINEKMSEKLSDTKGARGKMISWVENQPHYTQCILHIEAYRNYHKAEKEEFVQRIQVIDERYAIYGNWIDRIQISIIVLSAVAAFVQAGNTVMGFSDIIIQFVTLCISSYSALVLSISKYYKLDEQKENMNNLRNQCADLVGELGAREDRLNTLCFKELWTGPPGAPAPPVLEAWKNERAELFTSLKSIIQKKQTLVSIFNQLIDSADSRKLMLRARENTIRYKKEKYRIGHEEILLIARKNALKRKFKDVNKYNQYIEENTESEDKISVATQAFQEQEELEKKKAAVDAQLKEENVMMQFVENDPLVPLRQSQETDIEANIIVDSSFNTVNP